MGNENLALESGNAGPSPRLGPRLLWGSLPESAEEEKWWVWALHRSLSSLSPGAAPPPGVPREVRLVLPPRPPFSPRSRGPPGHQVHTRGARAPARVASFMAPDPRARLVVE